ncbi:hypothetical protein N9L68_03875 [bacterium]|nr:hypothetical protein [bacterium]
MGLVGAPLCHAQEPSKDCQDIEGIVGAPLRHADEVFQDDQDIEGTIGVFPSDTIRSYLGQDTPPWTLTPPMLFYGSFSRIRRVRLLAGDTVATGSGS